MKSMHIICSGFCKHGRNLFKFGMPVSIGYGTIDNENRVNKDLVEILKYTKNLEIFIF